MVCNRTPRTVVACVFTFTQLETLTVKYNYEISDDLAFSVDSLTPGEIGVEFFKLSERENKDGPIIELMARIFWVADESNEEHIGKEFKHPIFFGKKNEQNIRILLDLFRRSGFQVTTWNSENKIPLGVGIPGSIKLLVLHKVPMIGKVVRTERDGVAKNFFNLTKLLRESPVDGVTFEDSLPDPVPNEMIVDAYNAEVEGDTTESLL